MRHVRPTTLYLVAALCAAVIAIMAAPLVFSFLFLDQDRADRGLGRAAAVISRKP